MPTWRCIHNCGACCQLNPSDRPDLDTYLTPKELTLYLSMVGEDGWCVHFDRVKRVCTIYEQRPGFCRVETESFVRMYGIAPEALHDFAIDCCLEQIESVYGVDSPELERFQEEIQQFSNE